MQHCSPGFDAAHTVKESPPVHAAKFPMISWVFLPEGLGACWTHDCVDWVSLHCALGLHPSLNATQGWSASVDPNAFMNASR